MTLLAENLALSAGNRCLLAPATLRLAPGAVTAILGPNGAGKSTLLNVLAGARRPERGGVRLDGAPVCEVPPAALALRRALMPQDSGIAFDFTAHEVVALGRFPHRAAPCPDDHPDGGEDAIVAAAMAATDVLGLAPRVLNTLSGGERARVQLARALAQLWQPRPGGASRWLLLDEPTAALDLAHQHAALRLLRGWAARGVGVALVLHDLNLARRYADAVVVLDGAGGMQAGPTAEVLVPARIAQVWDMPCEAVVAGDGVAQFLFA